MIFRLLGICLAGLILLSPVSAQTHEPDKAEPEGKEGLVFVAMGTSGNIAVIDIATGKVVKTLGASANTHGIALAPRARRLYTTGRKMAAPKLFGKISPAQARVSAVDVMTGDRIAQIDVGGQTHHAWISRDGKVVYVSVQDKGVLAVIDSDANKVIGQVATGDKPNSIVDSLDGKLIFVTNQEGDSLAVVDRQSLKVIKTISLGKGPDHIELTPDGKRLYITNGFSNDVYVVDVPSLKVVASIKTGKGAHGVAVTPDGKKVFVSNRGDGTLSVILTSTNKVLSTKKLGKGPGHVSIAPDGKHLYVADESLNQLLVIDPRKETLIDRIQLWPTPHQMVIFQPEK